MKECKLTKRPCRAAIRESVDKCKDVIGLRDIYRIAELIRKSKDNEEFKELTEAEFKKALIIRNVLLLDDYKTNLTHTFINGVEGKKKRK